MLSRRRLFYGAVGLMVCALFALGDHKGKPHGKPGGGGDPPPGGTVYFMSGGLAWTMDTDGSGKTALPANVHGEPSHDLHGSMRWFLQERGGQLFAVREDGDEGVTVQLSTDPDLEQAGPARWSADDSSVSWVAERSVGGTVVETGIYVAGIVFDGAGNVVGLDAQPLVPAIDLPVPLNAGMDGDHDWAPDGTQIAYVVTIPFSEIYVADLDGGGSTFLDTGLQPAWSPDGARIAYQKFDGIHTIRPDGSDGTRIISAGSANGPNATFVALPEWAPTSSHLVYYRAPRSIENPDPGEIWRATAGGKEKTNLTASFGPDAVPVAWR